MMPGLVFALLIAIGAIFPAAASAALSDATLSDTDPVYLALGDSLAFGAGASDPEETGYVPLVHEFLRGVPCHVDDDAPCSELQLLNLAENGATTTSLRDMQLPAALDVIEQRNTDDYPGNDVVAITIDIGGNDAVDGVFDACEEGITLACGAAIRETLTIIDRNLTVILTQLRAAAGPDTRIAVMTYFNSFVGCDYRDVADDAELILEGVPGITPGLNGVIERVAERADVATADTFGRLGPDDLIGGEDCLHANDDGYAKIARAFMSVLAPASDVDEAWARICERGTHAHSRVHGGTWVTAPCGIGTRPAFPA